MVAGTADVSRVTVAVTQPHEIGHGLAKVLVDVAADRRYGVEEALGRLDIVVQVVGADHGIVLDQGCDLVICTERCLIWHGCFG